MAINLGKLNALRNNITPSNVSWSAKRKEVAETIYAMTPAVLIEILQSQLITPVI